MRRGDYAMMTLIVGDSDTMLFIMSKFRQLYNHLLSQLFPRFT